MIRASKKRSPRKADKPVKDGSLEREIQARIIAEIGSEADLLLMRNHVGVANVVRSNGRIDKFRHGLGKGSPDLVGILLCPEDRSQWFCLEVKRPGKTATEDQKKCHLVWRRFGAFIETVSSPEEARDALGRARKIYGVKGT